MADRRRWIGEAFDSSEASALTTFLGWNVTVGDDYLSVELAQPDLDFPISDGQVRAFCWWIRKFVLPRWPDLPMHFPTHSEVANNGETEEIDGETDAFPWQNVDEANALRQRIVARLEDRSWPETCGRLLPEVAWRARRGSASD